MLCSLPGLCRHLRRSRSRVKHQGRHRLIYISAVEVQKKVGLLVDLLHHSPGDLLGHRTLLRRRKDPVDILSIAWHHLFASGIKALAIDQRQQDHPPPNLGRSQLSKEPPQRHDAHIFTAMDACGQHQSWAARCSANHPYRQAWAALYGQCAGDPTGLPLFPICYLHGGSS